MNLHGMFYSKYLIVAALAADFGYYKHSFVSCLLQHAGTSNCVCVQVVYMVGLYGWLISKVAPSTPFVQFQWTSDLRQYISFGRVSLQHPP